MAQSTLSPELGFLLLPPSSLGCAADGNGGCSGGRGGCRCGGAGRVKKMRAARAGGVAVVGKKASMVADGDGGGGCRGGWKGN